MKEIIEYLYYRIYLWRKKDVPEWTASFAIALLMFIKLFILFLLFDIINIYFFNIYNYIFKINKIIPIVIMGILMVQNYFWFVHKKKYLKIVEKYKNETKKQKSVRGLLIFLYVIFSIGIIFLLAYIGKHGRM